MNASLTTSSMIVLVVAIIKYFSGKHKQKMEHYSEEIFPVRSLFNNMTVQRVEIKDRKLRIAD